jgi:peptide/nickel transport system permease protein
VSQTQLPPATLAEGAQTPTPPGRPTTLLSRSLRLWRTRIGAAFLLLLVLVAVFGPFLAPHGASQFITIPNSPPGGKAGVLGTDYLGQDVLSR